MLSSTDCFSDRKVVMRDLTEPTFLIFDVDVRLSATGIIGWHVQHTLKAFHLEWEIGISGHHGETERSAVGFRLLNGWKSAPQLLYLEFSWVVCLGTRYRPLYYPRSIHGRRYILTASLL